MPDNIKFVKEDEAQAYSDELNKPSRMSFQEGGAPKLPSKVATRKQAEALQDQQGGGTVVMQNPDGTFSVVSNNEGYSFGYNLGGGVSKKSGTRKDTSKPKKLPRDIFPDLQPQLDKITIKEARSSINGGAAIKGNKFTGTF
mgnify:CR=1 FL=1